VFVHLYARTRSNDASVPVYLFRRRTQRCSVLRATLFTEAPPAVLRVVSVHDAGERCSKWSFTGYTARSRVLRVSETVSP
jgi:hypothetical protein